MNYGTITAEMWQDPFFGDLTPEERYFFIYLNSCPHGQMCGVWPFNKRLSAAETGYNEETVMRLVDRLKDDSRVLYDQETREIMLVGWGERNAGLFRSTPGLRKNTNSVKLHKEMAKIKNVQYKRQVEQWLIDGGSMGDQCPMDGTGNTTTTGTLTGTEQHYTSTLPPAPKSSSVSASPVKKFNAIPESIFNMLPDEKQKEEKNLKQIAAALNKYSEDVVLANIKIALVKSKEDDPWNLAFPMLSAMANGVDWYSGERENSLKKANKNEAVAAKRHQELDAREWRTEKENLIEDQVTDILKGLTSEVREEIMTAAKSKCKEMDLSLSDAKIETFARLIIAEKFGLN